MPLWQTELDQAIRAGRATQDSYSELLDVVDNPELQNVVRDLLLMEEMNETLLRSLGQRHATR